MTPSELAVRVGDSAQHPELNYGVFDLTAVKNGLTKDGYFIVRGLIPEKNVSSIREFWLTKFKEKAEGRVTWSPYLGQENHIGFSADKFQFLFRACDFIWNKPFHKETRAVGVFMHALRNLVIDRDPSYGLRFTDGRYGVFLTTSYYPPSKGFMEAHNDGVSHETTLIHCLAPFTFRGRDYAEGGITIIDRHGTFLDVEKELGPGDVLFYDGALKHGVSPIVALPGKDLGRLQMIPIPTYFDELVNNPRALDAIPASTYVLAKAKILKNKLRIALGLKPGLR